MKFSDFKNFSISKQFLFSSLGVIITLMGIVSTYMINTSIQSKNDQFQIMANGRSSAVIEKIDRNYYERFGDVQAFAVNKLALEAVKTNATSEELQSFINTMVSYYVLYDLMLLCDNEGKVLVANTNDKNGVKIKTDFLIGKDFSNEEWFRVCISGNGPEGGAWYSDFIKNEDVSKIYNGTGYGMGFAAPVKDEEGKTIGVWYNFANWQDVTTGIRQETEDVIKKSNPGSFILITDSKNNVIDSNDPGLVGRSQVSIEGFQEGATFYFQGKEVNNENYIVGGMQGKGAYIYKGKNWKAITFVPKTKFSISYISNNLLILLFGIPILTIIASVFLYKIADSVSKNIEELKNNITILSSGELVDIKETSAKNELGEMTSALKSMVFGLRNTANFANKIGHGELQVEYKALSVKDEIGNSLLIMRDNLSKIKEEDKRREWANTGTAQISELLRSNFTQVTDLYDAVLKFIITYTGSNQGGIFLIEEGNSDHLHLVASYAYERKKFIEKKVMIGESLVGQCYLEQETIFLKQIPPNYINITSGLGDTPPSCIIIIPLKINEIMVGVLELASLNLYQPHERNLLEKFAENVASTIANVKINARTKVLLEQSQQQAEEMKAQEEEMRQNMEELTATQEEMKRKENEYLKKIEELEDTIDNWKSKWDSHSLEKRKFNID